MINVKTVLSFLYPLIFAATAYAATAVTDTRNVVHVNSSGEIVHATSGTCVRSSDEVGYDECGLTIVQQQPHAHILSREERTVYFAFNQSTLSPEMKARLDTLAGVMRSDSQVKGARIVGYADRIGNAHYNDRLSQKRATAVKSFLVAHGIINTQVAKTKWLGSSAPVTDCPDGMSRTQLIGCLQEDRRVEVEIDYAPDQNASR